MKVSFELDATWSHLLFAIIELVTIVESSILFSIYRNLLTQGVTKADTGGNFRHIFYNRRYQNGDGTAQLPIKK